MKIDRRRNRGLPPIPPTTIVRGVYVRNGSTREVVTVRLKPTKRTHLRYIEIRWLDERAVLHSASAAAFERWAAGTQPRAVKIQK